MISSLTSEFTLKSTSEEFKECFLLFTQLLTSKAVVSSFKEYCRRHATSDFIEQDSDLSYHGLNVKSNSIVEKYFIEFISSNEFEALSIEFLNSRNRTTLAVENDIPDETVIFNKPDDVAPRADAMQQLDVEVAEASTLECFGSSCIGAEVAVYNSKTAFFNANFNGGNLAALRSCNHAMSEINVRMTSYSIQLWWWQNFGMYYSQLTDFQNWWNVLDAAGNSNPFVVLSTLFAGDVSKPSWPTHRFYSLMVNNGASLF